MKTINLYFDFEFTSLSPDAQPISLGIVSEHTMIIKTEYLETLDKTKSYHFKNDYPPEKSFYAEFSDFDINRCDNWVKENVVSKLMYYGTPEQNKMFLDSSIDEGTYWGSNIKPEIQTALWKWLEQFSEYQIQFVKDAQSTKGTGLDWLTLVDMLRIDNPLKDYVFIEMTKGYKTIIDISDYKNVSKHSWCAHIYKNKCYPETRIKGKAIRLHQFLMGEQPFDGAIIDHINGNSLDNRKSNLRWITHQQNNHNTSSRKSTSKYKGVRWHENLNKWSAFISKGGKYFHLGMYVKEEDAAKAYNEIAKCFFGEFSKLNEFNYFPKLPANISPVPFDLNDLIAIRKDITPMEAFDLDREQLTKWIDLNEFNLALTGSSEPLQKEDNKHNALYNAKVIKGIYNNLI